MGKASPAESRGSGLSVPIAAATRNSYLAAEGAQEAFHNVAYFAGTFELLIQQVAIQ